MLRIGGNSAGEHVGMDVSDHIDLGGYTIDVINTWTVQDKVMFILRAPVRSTVRCIVHPRGEGCQHCMCVPLGCDIDVSGFPCTDWSVSGNRLGVRGPTFVVLLCLVAWYRASRIPLIVLEKVPELDTSVLQTLLGDIYELVFVCLSPADVACEFINRKRLFVWGMLRGFSQEGLKAYQKLLNGC